MISLNTGVDNYIFWSEIGSGFEELGGTSPPRIPRRPPPPPPPRSGLPWRPTAPTTLGTKGLRIDLPS